ncbi:signal peptidase I [Halococcus agarilyticus]|uniref:signal peptidase I n=1 Tax=Halococcus agarilyticus TaxID=1232219 RepID=UPI001E61828E|nr:signal peptidase I [Halococcus agarilyticus]
MIVVLVVLIVPFVVFTVPQVVEAEQSYVIASGSMTPAISPNDAIIVNDVSPTSVEEGDVIVFSERGESDSDNIDVTSHRVVDVTNGENGLAFKTKGDANEEADQGLVPASALVGRVTFTIPFIGYVIGFASGQLGFLTLVGVPVGLLILGEVYDLAVAARNTRQEAGGTTEAEPEDETVGTSVENDATPGTDTQGSMTENASPSGFDPGVTAVGNGAPPDIRDPRTEPIDPTTGDENGEADDA